MSTSVELIGFGEKDSLWRWDTNRQIRIIPETGATIDEICFSNIFSETPLKVEPKTNEHGDIVADIPNILLQDILPIDVQVIMFFNNGKQTIYNTSYKVKNCKKPPEYVYTETEIKNYESLEKRIEALEQNGTGGGIEEESDPTVPDWAKQPEKPSYTAEDVGAVGKDELSEAINAALTQAKESGEFKGEKGDTFTYEDFTEEQLETLKGAKGDKPVKGTDYFTEADKAELVTDVLNALPTWQGGAF